MRGPLASPSPLTNQPVPLHRRSGPAGFFAESMRRSLARIAAVCPRALGGIDVGFEEIPNVVGKTSGQRVPLATAVGAKSGRNAQVILFRRPLERRANSRTELRRLVHRTLVEQISALTGISLDELDPSGETGEGP